MFVFWLVNGSIMDRFVNIIFIVIIDIEVIVVFKLVDKYVVLYVDLNN